MAPVNTEQCTKDIRMCFTGGRNPERENFDLIFLVYLGHLAVTQQRESIKYRNQVAMTTTVFEHPKIDCDALDVYCFAKVC